MTPPTATVEARPAWCWLNDVATRACWERLEVLPPDHVPPVASVAEWQEHFAGALLLRCERDYLGLYGTGRALAKPLIVDFMAGTMGFRGQQNVRSEALVKAVLGRRKDHLPTVADATGGLGRDAFILATLGCDVWVWERHPAVFLLLKDGLFRAQSLSPVQRIRLCAGPFQASEVSPHREVICLDPMFPAREKSAQVKKEMQAFHQLIGADPDEDALFAQALAAQPKRIVVKRPRLAPPLAGRTPTHVLTGRASRFDVYQLD